MPDAPADIKVATERLQRLVQAYNAGDAKAFAAEFAAAGRICEYPTHVLQDGRDAIETQYSGLFQKHPGNRVEVLVAIVLGERIVHHERIRREEGAEPFDSVTIYSFADDGITTAEFVASAPGRTWVVG